MLQSKEISDFSFDMQEALAAKEAADKLEIRALPVRQYLVHYTLKIFR